MLVVLDRFSLLVCFYVFMLVYLHRRISRRARRLQQCATLINKDSTATATAAMARLSDSPLPRDLPLTDPAACPLMVLPPEILHLIVESVAELGQPPHLDPGRSGMQRRRQAERHALEALSLCHSVFYTLSRPFMHRTLFFELPSFITSSEDLSEPDSTFNKAISKCTSATSWKGSEHVQAFWYFGAQFVSPALQRTFEHETNQPTVLKSAILSFSNLTFLELNGVSEHHARLCLETPPPFLKALSLEKLSRRRPSTPFDIPHIPTLEALKIFECPSHWCSIISGCKKLKHLVVWLPDGGFQSLDWLGHDQMETLELLNLDGFKKRPELFAQFLRVLSEFTGERRLKSLDIEHNFTIPTLQLTLDALQGYELDCLAISCVTRHLFKPSVVQLIAGAVPSVQFLTIMVKNYTPVYWPGDMKEYAHALSTLPRLHTFAFNHSASMQESFTWDNDGEDTTGDFHEDDQDEEEDHEDGGASRQRLIQQAGHAQLIQCTSSFLSECKQLKRIIRVEALWADRATGSVLEKTSEEDTTLSTKVNLKHLLLPFEGIWAKI